MAKTIEELKAQGAEVKNATVVGENTATRVGTLFTDIVEHVEQYEAGQTADTEANTLAISNEAQARAKADEQLNTAIVAEKERAKAAEEELRQSNYELFINQKVAIREWDWSGFISSSVSASGSVIIPEPLQKGSYYIRAIFPFAAVVDVDFYLYTKNDDGTYQEQRKLYTFSKENLITDVMVDCLIPEMVEVGDTDLYFGCTNCKYNNSASDGQFALANGSTYKGLLLNCYIINKLTKEVQDNTQAIEANAQAIEAVVVENEEQTQKLSELEEKQWKILKYIAVSTDDISVKIERNILNFHIGSSAYLFLKKDAYNRIDYIKIPETNLSISLEKVIAFSDTEGSYTKCTYGSTVYLVETTRANVSYDDVIVGIVNTQVYSNYPIILDSLYKSISDGSLSVVEKKVLENKKSIEDLEAEISSLPIGEWDWRNSTDSAVTTTGVVIPTPITVDGYISFDIYNIAPIDVVVSLYTKSGEDIFEKVRDIYTFRAEQNTLSSHTIPNKVEADNEYYLGISKGSVGYINSAKPNGQFRYLGNNGTYYGLCLSFSISGGLVGSVQQLEKEQSLTKEELQALSEKVDNIQPNFKELEDNEYWTKVQGNKFSSDEIYLSGGAEISDTTITLSSAGAYAALDKQFWSNRRIHRITVIPSTLGTIVINMAQNKSNTMFPSFGGSSWTSKFKIDFVNKKVYMANDMSFDLDMDFIAGRKYVVELKYVKRIFTVTVTDFTTQQSSSAVLDARSKNINGGFKNTLVIYNESGSYIVSDIQTYEVSNPLLVIFGDSVTEAIGRVGQGENYSEIISETIKSCTIIAQGGSGAGSWDYIFENEIKYIKPRYCSYHMAINGGVSQQYLEKFVSDCLSIGTIPIINHCICTASYVTDNTDATWNAIIDMFCKEHGYMGCYGDIATAQNNDVNSTPNYIGSSIESGTKRGIKKCSMSLDCYPTRSLAVGTTVVENGVERILDAELPVIVDIHPNATGHRKMADRYLSEVKMLSL